MHKRVIFVTPEIVDVLIKTYTRKELKNLPLKLCGNLKAIDKLLNYINNEGKKHNTKK